jgi:hypothetical protein
MGCIFQAPWVVFPGACGGIEVMDPACAVQLIKNNPVAYYPCGPGVTPKYPACLCVGASYGSESPCSAWQRLVCLSILMCIAPHYSSESPCSARQCLDCLSVLVHQPQLCSAVPPLSIRPSEHPPAWLPNCQTHLLDRLSAPPPLQPHQSLARVL